MNYIIYFLYLFSIPIKALPMNSSKCVVIFLIMVNGLDWMRIKKINMKKVFSEIPTSGFLLALIGFSLIVMAGHQSHQVNVAYAYVLMLAEDLFGSFLFFRYLQKQGKEKDFMDIYITVCCMQGILILLMYLSQEFRFWGYEFMGVDRYYLNRRYGGFRGLGFAGSVTYDFSVIQSLALGMIALRLKDCTLKRVLKYSIFFPCILFSVLVSGRTGYIGIFVSLILLVYELLLQKRNRNVVIYILFLCQIVLICLFCLFLAPQEIKEGLKKVYEFAFEVIHNLIERGELGTSSTDKLKAMFWIPPVKTLILGDGYYLNPENLLLYYRETDSGYMRHLLYYGIFGSMLLYSFYLLLFKRMFQKVKENNRRDYSIWVILLALYYFIVHVKGDFLMGSRLATKAVLGIYFLFFYNLNYKKERF